MSREDVEALLARADEWRRHDPDPDSAAELTKLAARRDEAELAARFLGPLRFGTSGLRGVLGAGPARMNRAVVRQATVGLARHLLATVPDARARGVVVGRDTRRQSDVFADDVAGVLAAHGIPALVFPKLASTPLVAFAVQYLKAAAAVMITASHNAAEYNGYKVWWGHGAQIVPPHDVAIGAEMANAGHADGIAVLSRQAAQGRGLWRDVSREIEAAYGRWLAAVPLHAGEGRDLAIVYTPLHGVGGLLVPQALAKAGFAHVIEVTEQARPDGAFPTVCSPNPEESGALERALALAERESFDLVLANDPDADRLGVAARDSQGRLRILSGNEIGVLLGHQRLGRSPSGAAQPLVVTTIVSSPLLGVIARAHGARYEETLTGFKWIANRALELEREAGVSFVFGYEEALGFSIGTAVRDKDGVSAALAVADLAGRCRALGTTLLERLEAIQREYGLHLSAQRFLPAGDESIGGAELMARVRARLPQRVGHAAVTAVRDYGLGVWRFSGGEHSLGLPRADVLVIELSDGSRVSIRPSGTEAKVKLYFDLAETIAPGETLAVARVRGEARLSELAAAVLADVIGSASQAPASGA
jgi:phosphomannomutase